MAWMGSDEVARKHPRELRARAERIVATEGQYAADLSPAEIREIAHELHTHQAELEV
jgi:epoxyqueuosine reductase QueG